MVFVDIFYYCLNSFFIMEKINLRESAYRYNGQPVEEICLFDNGSFSVETADNHAHKVCYLFDANGKVFLSGQSDLEFGAVLADGYTLVKERVGHKFMLCDASFCPVYAGIEKFQTFPNDWYELQIGAYKRLFNAKHQLMAKGYGQCAVFNAGYYLDEDGDGAVWNVYLPDGEYKGVVENVVSFVGDGNRLVEKERSEACDVVGFNGKLILEDVFSSVYQFPNGRFVLKFAVDGTEKMFSPDGRPMNARTKGVQILPDGRFVVYVEPGHRIIGLYDRNGIVTKNEVWQLQMAGNYYLIEAEHVKGRLFDDNMTACGDGYCLVTALGDFALFEHNGPKLELFNRNGKVFTSED